MSCNNGTISSRRTAAIMMSTWTICRQHYKTALCRCDSLNHSSQSSQQDVEEPFEDEENETWQSGDVSHLVRRNNVIKEHRRRGKVFNSDIQTTVDVKETNEDAGAFVLKSSSLKGELLQQARLLTSRTRAMQSTTARDNPPRPTCSKVITAR